jgi:type II secretory pathway component GspD/PulD (secretin)
VIENNVIADDGQIIVLGGLIEDTEGDGTDKVRGLGDIPVLGNLFKYQSRTRKKTNLMVFLRPVVIRNKEQSTSLATDRYDYMRAAAGSRQTGRQHTGQGSGPAAAAAVAGRRAYRWCSSSARTAGTSAARSGRRRNWQAAVT